MNKMLTVLLVAALYLCTAIQANAIPIGGVEFPAGAVSFADAVVSYQPVTYGSTDQYPTERDPEEALGVPDYTSGPGFDYVTLGPGGYLTLQFTDNSLSGSGNSDLDLWIFEIGGDIEDTFVWISKDNNTWNAVGKVFGSTGGIDIDAFGFGIDDLFSFIRLQDDPNEGQGLNVGTTAGADIDAVGAISSSRPVNVVPEPSTFLLLGGGLAGLAFYARRRREE